MVPLGSSTVAIESGARTSSSDRSLATSLAGSSWMRIAGVCWPPIVTCATPGIWLICWTSLVETLSVDHGQRQRLGTGGKEENGESAGLTFLKVGGVGKFFGNWRRPR